MGRVRWCGCHSVHRDPGCDTCQTPLLGLGFIKVVTPNLFLDTNSVAHIQRISVSRGLATSTMKGRSLQLHGSTLHMWHPKKGTPSCCSENHSHFQRCHCLKWYSDTQAGHQIRPSKIKGLQKQHRKIYTFLSFFVFCMSWTILWSSLPQLFHKIQVQTWHFCRQRTHDLSPLVLDHKGEAVRTRGLAPFANPTLLENWAVGKENGEPGTKYIEIYPFILSFASEMFNHILWPTPWFGEKLGNGILSWVWICNAGWHTRKHPKAKC